MKKRIVALLLTLVFVVSMLPMSAFAKDNTTLIGGEALESDVVCLSADRRTVLSGDQVDYVDHGAGTTNTFLIPQGEGTITFEITRTAYDSNRWWRWSQPAEGMSARIIHDWQIGEIPVRDYDVEVPVSQETKHCYILSRFKYADCYQWSGGSSSKCATATVTVDCSQAVGTTGILLSANGVEKDAMTNLLTVTTNRYVDDNKDGVNAMIVIGRVDIVYDDGLGHENRYVCWTTGDPSTSQIHTVPEEPGVEAWYCLENEQTYYPGDEIEVTQPLNLIPTWCIEPWGL